MPILGGIIGGADAAAWVSTFGRAHVLLVHFPIGLLLVAGVVELWQIVRRRPQPSVTAITCFALGTVFTLAAACSGWIHKSDSISGHASSTVQVHLVLGFATAVLAVVAVVLLTFKRVRIYRAGLLLCAALVAATGHFGGVLTHGSGYLTEFLNQPKQPPQPPVAILTVSTDPTKIHFPPDGKIDFIQHVQPILLHSCYECHGVNKTRGALRLDSKALAMKGGKNGPTIIPADSEKSPIIRRVLGLDNQKRMPMGKDPLPEEHLRILRGWIDQGATWPDAASNDQPGQRQKHWAYVKPVRLDLPRISDTSWPRNAIDHFILARMEADGLKPSREADRVTLIRRLSLDLTGLPPTPEEVDAFVNDQSSDAYEKLVDRLLASPHYGERWGRHWLDIARYADTNGYEKDRPRVIWPYRDWVIKAINDDLPFDQFVIQQIAGDMLPGATVEQKIATGFHRNTMYNEEGGIDIEEFRYKAIVDRVQTTSSAFLGLTMQCAQCHNHKYDDISQQEYFQFFALMNNADEPEFKIPSAQIDRQREEIEQKIAAMERELESQFPHYEQKLQWQTLDPIAFSSTSGAEVERLDDGSVRAGGERAKTDSYSVVVKADLADATVLRLEALTDESLPNKGPGRADNGNFVVSELHATRLNDVNTKNVALQNPTADFFQADYEVAKIIDGNPSTGWAIANPGGNTNQNRAAQFDLAEKLSGAAALLITLEQNLADHPIGRFRISAGKPAPPPQSDLPIAEQRRQFLQQKQDAWETHIAAHAVKWTILEPAKFARFHDGTITKLNDHSLLFTGDNYYREQYDLEYVTELKNITALRIEVLPHDDLPKGGPGRNETGGFLLSELTVSAAPLTQPDQLQPVELQNPTASASPETALRAIDGLKDTHWTIPVGGDGRPRIAVFELTEPLNAVGRSRRAGMSPSGATQEGDAGVAPTSASGVRLMLSIAQNYHQSENLGRVRVSVAADADGVQASGVPAEIEQIILIPSDQRSADQQTRLRRHFLLTTPLLAAQQQEIAKVRATMPAHQTTLVMQERQRPRITRIHHRGEYLQPRDSVEPAVPAVLPPLPAGQKTDRLTLAYWLVDPENPLIGRVTMNRVWSRYFGRGIVNTVDDFGVMGEQPTHPELLDWLATELLRRHWSMKSMHKLIVTSAAYRQASQVTPELQEKDPDNLLIARGPRVRVEAEIVRDIALQASGLLNPTVGGPSVYPPQPPGITELSYGPLPWPTSTGADRYRRGMYTFIKRTSLYPGLTVFDAPTSEVVCARRIRSNTPLQALMLLNDEVFVEAARALALRVTKETPPDVEQRIAQVFRLCVARGPDEKENKQVKEFFAVQLKRFRDKTADPAPVALADSKAAPADVDLPELAAWTTVARAVLNLDETVTKE